jgi:hypothetical protein
MTQQQIRTFYKAYRQQILDEMQEYYDMPFTNVEKIDDNKYIAYEGDVKVIFTFVRRFGSDLVKLPNIVDKELVKEYYERSWGWADDTPDDKRNPKNFLRAIGTSFRITKQFFQDKPKCKVILFTPLREGHNSIYNDKSRYSKKLMTILGDQYYYLSDSDNFRYWIIDKDVINYKDQNHLWLRMEMLKETLDEATQYWYFPLRHPSTPTNVKIKAKIKQRVLELIYSC